MKVQTLQGLIDLIDKAENFNHEIKGKRLKKQLKSLSQIHFQFVQFKNFQITNVAILINIIVHQQQNNSIDLTLRLDREYPFNPPQLFYHNHNNNNELSEYGYCLDLLSTLLKNQIWGPSLTLPHFIEKLPQLMKNILNKQQVVAMYHSMFEYGEDELKKSGVKLYNIQQYKWEYKVLKMKKLKILGITPNHILKFQRLQKSDNILRLDFWAPIKDITEVNAKTGKKNFNLQLDYKDNQNKAQKMYLGGDPKDLEPILDGLNPIQMIERKVKNYEKSGATNYQDAINSYSTLIQHYSLINKQTTDKYITAMKKLIQSHYSEDSQKQSNHKSQQTKQKQDPMIQEIKS